MVFLMVVVDSRDRSSGEERLLQDIAIGEILGNILDNLCKVWDVKHGSYIRFM